MEPSEEVRNLSVKEYTPIKLHSAGSTLVEVHYITIHPEKSLDDDDDEPLVFEVYGVIQATNGKGESFYLYNQPEEDSESMESGDKLALIDTRPISSPFPVTNIHIHIMDKTKGLEIANGDITLNYQEKEICFDERKNKYVDGLHGFVDVSYTTFESAIVACFEVEKRKKDDPCESGSHYVPIVGEISISYDCNYSFLSKQLHTPILWAEPIADVKLECGIPLPLCKSSVAVPGYASLKVKACLEDIVNVNAIISPMSYGYFGKKIEGYNGYYIKVSGQWCLGNPTKVLSRPRNEFIGNDCPSDLHILRLPDTWDYAAEMLTEVFSIVIFPDKMLNANKVIQLYGTIYGFGAMDDEFLFNRDESAPESFISGECNILTPYGPHRFCFAGYRPGVKVELKDVEGHVFCKGVIPWDGHNLFFDREISWYDKRLCYIIKGDFGFVKVYYTIFDAATQATVKIWLSFDHTIASETDFYGSIIASYDNFDYTSYEMKYYRSMLFLKSEESSLKYSGGRKIPFSLSKSAICVPKDSLLVVEVDMSFMIGSCVENLKGLAKFEVGRNSWWRLTNNSFFVDVSVDWVNIVSGRSKKCTILG